MAGYASNCPISRPNTAIQFSNNVDMNGFGWDKNYGLFIPSDQSVDATTPPTMVLPQMPPKNTGSVA
jgi:hypothetical protein